MSAFLWVEDFEGGQYREFGHALFGRALGLDNSIFPNDENELRVLMKSHQVELVTSFAEAAHQIDENLRDYDYVILDIDLNLVDDKSEDYRPLVLPFLERWYSYDPNPINEEASYEAARQKMKPVAGYHLFIDLVMNRGFPRERILFCSNHGNYLDSINKSFEPARIEAPSIYRKSDPEVTDWITDQIGNSYLKLRRLVILACRELIEQLKFGKIQFTMCNLISSGNTQLTPSNAEILLETLPMLLPAHENSEFELKTAFRLFARTLTQDWDKVDYKSKHIKLPEKAFSAVLVNVRNWTSHDADALSVMDEGFVAFLFLISMRSCFGLPINNIEQYEKGLFQLIGKAEALDMNKLTQDYMQSHQEIECKYTLLNLPKVYFSDMVNTLQQNHKIAPEEQYKLLCQVLWHQLHWGNQQVYSPRSSYFSKPAFLDQLTQRIYQRSFS